MRGGINTKKLRITPARTNTTDYIHPKIPQPLTKKGSTSQSNHFGSCSFSPLLQKPFLTKLGTFHPLASSTPSYHHPFSKFSFNLFLKSSTSAPEKRNSSRHS